MRIFTLANLSSSKPIKVFITDDLLELPDQLSNLRVYFLFKCTHNVLKYYQEQGAFVCFVCKEDAEQVNSGFVVGWRVVLQFIALLCQREKICRIVIK